MIVRLDDAIKAEMQRYIHQEGHALNETQLGALTRYAADDQILGSLSEHMWQEFWNNRDRVTFHSYMKKVIEDIKELYKGDPHEKLPAYYVGKIEAQ